MDQLSVFGGTGFIGKEFCRITNKKLTLIDREGRASVSDDILYLISTTDNYNVFDDIFKDVNINLTVLLEVLQNLKNPSKTTFNFISSWFVYGECPLPANEKTSCHPKGFYSITKRTAEQLIISYCETFKINYRIIRLCNVYGRGDKGISKRKNALQYLINQLKNNEEVNLYNNGEFYRDYMHVTDVAKAIDLCLQDAPLNQIINIGSGEKTKFRSLIDSVVKITQSTSIINNVEPPEFHKTVQVKDFYMDIAHLKNLGFKQSISLEEGLRELCQ